MLFKNRLRALREDSDLTQLELAKLIHSSRVAINSYENGYRQPNVETLIRLADYFDVSLDYFLCRTKLMTSFSKNNK